MTLAPAVLCNPVQMQPGADAVVGPNIAAWRLNRTAEWHWRDWGGDSVVIEVRSGQTLQFDPLSAAVMACIEAGATDMPSLGAALGEDLGAVADAELSGSLCLVVERLSRLGWIEPVLPAGT